MPDSTHFRNGVKRFLKYAIKERDRLRKLEEQGKYLSSYSLLGRKHFPWLTRRDHVWLRKKCKEHANYTETLRNELSHFYIAYKITKYPAANLFESAKVKITDRLSIAENILRDVWRTNVEADKIKKQITKPVSNAINVYNYIVSDLESIYEKTSKLAA